MRQAIVATVLLLTAAACAPAGSSLHAAADGFTSSAACWQTYEVQPGDTLVGILGTSDTLTLEAVAVENRLADPDLIHVGDVLALPCVRPPGTRTPSVPQASTSSPPVAVATPPSSTDIPTGSTAVVPTSTSTTTSGGSEVPLPAFHVWYVVPSDVEPTFTDAQIRTSLQEVRGWMAAQTQDRVGFDIVYEGADRLSASDADLLGTASSSQFSLLVAPYVGSAGTAVILYGGTPIDRAVCGRGGSDGVAVVYVGPSSACGRTLAGNGVPFGPAESTFVHEVLHTLALPDAACGTGHVTDGHITDGSDDIMQSGGGPYDLFDPGHDDYYMPDVSAPLPCRYLTGNGTLHLP